MNDSNNPPPVPESARGGTADPATPPPPCLPSDDHMPIPTAATVIESMLRQPRRVLNQLRRPGSGQLICWMVGVSIVCSLIYGVVVGAFSGGTQLWAAPLKIAAGTLLSALICLPSLYIFACLSGSPARLVEIAGMVAGLTLLMTLLLVGFAPVAWVFSQSTGSVVAMGGLHLVFWLVSTWFGLRFLNAGFGTQPGRVDGIKVWMIVFVLVMLQMTTAVRPLIGTADTLLPTEKKFFVKHWLESVKREAAQ